MSSAADPVVLSPSNANLPDDPQAVGDMQGHSVTQPLRVKPIILKIAAYAVLFFSLAAITFGVGLLTSGAAFALYPLGVTGTKVFAVLTIALGCAGTLRGISMFEIAFSIALGGNESEEEPRVIRKRSPVIGWTNRVDMSDIEQQQKQNKISEEDMVKEWMARAQNAGFTWKLNLAGKKLETIPEDIFSRGELTVFDVSDNRLKAISDKIGQLEKLERIYLGRNDLTELPEAIWRLENLTELTANRNNLEKLPDNIGELQGLTALRVGNNRLKALPESICKLTGSDEVCAQTIRDADGQNKEIASVKGLVVSAGYNQLTHLPEQIGDITYLTKLEVGNNQLQELPASMENLKYLEYLDISNNPLAAIPTYLFGLDCLKTLVISRDQAGLIPDGHKIELIYVDTQNADIQDWRDREEAESAARKAKKRSKDPADSSHQDRSSSPVVSREESVPVVPDSDDDIDIVPSDGEA